jgi:thiol:disulfide interchange protein DsbC
MPSRLPLSCGRILAALFALAIACAPLGANAQAATRAPAADPGAAALAKALQQKFPGAAIRSVAKSPYFGLYEAQIDDQLVYTDAKATYVLVGAIYEADTKRNLTELRQRELNRISFAGLPFELAMKKVKGSGERKLAVFSDADCPFCARLENDLKNIDNVTIYTFLYPIDQLHPDSARKSKMIWCSPDKVKAWDDFFASAKLPDNAGDCANPVAATAALGQKLRVTATPTLVFADGSVVPGALPAQQLEALMKQAEQDANKAAGKK